MPLFSIGLRSTFSFECGWCSCSTRVRFYTFTACSDPGIVLEDEELKLSETESNSKFECGLCNILRPRRASHCFECGICVLELDHHCPVRRRFPPPRSRLLILLSVSPIDASCCIVDGQVHRLEDLEILLCLSDFLVCPLGVCDSLGDHHGRHGEAGVRPDAQGSMNPFHCFPFWRCNGRVSIDVRRRSQPFVNALRRLLSPLRCFGLCRSTGTSCREDGVGAGGTLYAYRSGSCSVCLGILPPPPPPSPSLFPLTVHTYTHHPPAGLLLSLPFVGFSM